MIHKEEEELRNESSARGTATTTIGAGTTNNNDNNNASTTSSLNLSLLLDGKWYYYQNPQTGTVSATPLNLGQLIRLVCPVRDGLKPILPPSTQCLPVTLVGGDSNNNNNDGEELQEFSATTSSTTSLFGEWKVVSEIDVLKEASCTGWFTTMTNKNSSSSNKTEGPLSSRALFESYRQQQQQQQKQQQQELKSSSPDDAEFDTASRFLVYAEGITSEWTDITNLPQLQLVFLALRGGFDNSNNNNNNNNPNWQNPNGELITTTTTTLLTDGDNDGRDDDDNNNNEPAKGLCHRIMRNSTGVVAQEKQQHRKDQEGNIVSDSIQDELEAFLSSTGEEKGRILTQNNKSRNRGIIDSNYDDDDNDDNDDDDDGHSYESDGGTRYLKDPLSRNWIHEALAQPPPESSARKTKSTSHNNKNGTTVTEAGTKPSSESLPDGKDNPNNNSKKKKKKKSKKAQFAKRNAKHWVYVSGLPTVDKKDDDDGPNRNVTIVTVEEVQRYFSKVGLLELDPETLQPKIKLYRDSGTGRLKGDASICYAHAESVDLALDILDDSQWDATHRIKVERAHFQAKGNSTNGDKDDVAPGDDKNATDHPNNNNNHDTKQRKRGRPTISEAQRKVARLAIVQAQDDGFGERLAGGRKGLRIIVVKGLMDGILDNELEDVVYETCQPYGPIEKITCISRTSAVIVKYVEPKAASEALQGLNGTVHARTGRRMKAIYWDGVTDYTKVHGDEEKEHEEEERRHEEFATWLESQEELPPELQLQVSSEE